ncbi:helix-turn-helix transcriptional regulator [Pseudonocardia sp. ICBG162]|uniref:helix-turn-helix domain-containing protein n=1 Tax=Pseudonocardia sp. ICBG162 TaxID=2846761 RepID=UPI001CF6C11D|nr:helix-turn-helix transcriptional regulator [Pseudonocardia sp. ICBG162]
MTATHGPVVIRRRLGWALKQLRVRRHKQLSEIAKILEISPSKLSRIETGQVEPKFRDVRDLLDIYDASETDRRRLLEWADGAKSRGWWQPLGPASFGVDLDMLISLETEARAKRMYCIPVAGLLQTEDYARQLITQAYSEKEPAEIDRMVEIRMGRQHVIDLRRSDAPPLELHVLMDEVALYRCSDPEVMRNQAAELIRRADQDNVCLQVVPFSAGWTNATSTFSIFDPRDPDLDWPVVNVEGTGSDSFVDGPQSLAGYESVWEELLGVALTPDASRVLIEAALNR